MSPREQLKKELYDAFLQAAIDMGSDLKSISWFGRSQNRFWSKSKAASGRERMLLEGPVSLQ